MNDEDLVSDSELLNWLQDEQVDTIYFDDGRMLDISAGNLRKKLRKMYDEEHAKAEQAEEEEIQDGNYTE